MQTLRVEPPGPRRPGARNGEKVARSSETAESASPWPRHGGPGTRSMSTFPALDLRPICPEKMRRLRVATRDERRIRDC